MQGRRLLQFMFCLPLALFLVDVAFNVDLCLSENVSPRIDAFGMLYSSIVLFSGYALFLAWALRRLQGTANYGQIRALLIACPLVGAVVMLSVSLIAGLITKNLALGRDLIGILAFYYGILAVVGYGYVFLVALLLAITHLIHRRALPPNNSFKPKPLRGSA